MHFNGRLEVHRVKISFIQLRMHACPPKFRARGYIVCYLVARLSPSETLFWQSFAPTKMAGSGDCATSQKSVCEGSYSLTEFRDYLPLSQVMREIYLSCSSLSTYGASISGDVYCAVLLDL